VPGDVGAQGAVFDILGGHADGVFSIPETILGCDVRHQQDLGVGDNAR